MTATGISSSCVEETVTQGEVGMYLENMEAVWLVWITGWTSRNEKDEEMMGTLPSPLQAKSDGRMDGLIYFV